MARLFLSYSRDDMARVEPLAGALKTRGHDLWWDRDIAGGAAFSRVIERALDEAEAVIVCWSAAASASDWVRDEAATGRDSGRLVPLTLDGTAPPLGFRQYQTIDLSQWNGKPHSEVLNALDKALAERTGAEPVTRGQAPPRTPWWPSVNRPTIAIGAAAIALIVGAGLVLAPRLGSSGRVEPKVAVGKFTVATAGIPIGLAEQIGHELVAAFGAENLVAVIAPGDQAVQSAPFIMDGSVTRSGPQTRVTVALRNPSSGVVLWSGSYENESPDVIAARQAAVGASQVVRCGLWGASSYPRSMSDQALSLYLKWCNEHWSGSTSETAELDAARRVTAEVPDFSFGWSALALAATALTSAPGSEGAKLRTDAEQAARKSMELDRTNPEGHMALAGLLPFNRFAEREALLKKAIGVRPTECGCERQAYGDFLASVGRMDEAAAEYARARDMRPLAPFSNLRLAQAMFMVGRNEEADAILNRTLEMWPDATSLRLLKIKSALWTRRHAETIALLDAPDLPLTSLQREVMKRAFAALGSGDSAIRQRSAAELERLAAVPRTNDRLVVALLAALGSPEAAIRAADALIRNRGLFDSEILFEPNLAAARFAPAYSDLVRRLGLVSYWQSQHQLPDLCREAPAPAFCPSS